MNTDVEGKCLTPSTLFKMAIDTMLKQNKKISVPATEEIEQKTHLSRRTPKYNV